MMIEVFKEQLYFITIYVLRHINVILIRKDLNLAVKFVFM